MNEAKYPAQSSAEYRRSPPDELKNPDCCCIADCLLSGIEIPPTGG